MIKYTTLRTSVCSLLLHFNATYVLFQIGNISIKFYFKKTPETNKQTNKNSPSQPQNRKYTLLKKRVKKMTCLFRRDFTWVWGIHDSTHLEEARGVWQPADCSFQYYLFFLENWLFPSCSIVKLALLTLLVLQNISLPQVTISNIWIHQSTWVVVRKGKKALENKPRLIKKLK